MCSYLPYYYILFLLVVPLIEGISLCDTTEPIGREKRPFALTHCQGTRCSHIHVCACDGVLMVSIVCGMVPYHTMSLRLVLLTQLTSIRSFEVRDLSNCSRPHSRHL